MSRKLIFMSRKTPVFKGFVLASVPKAQIPKGIPSCARDDSQKVLACALLNDCHTCERSFWWHGHISSKFWGKQVKSRPESILHTHLRTLLDINLVCNDPSWCNNGLCSLAPSTPRSIDYLLWNSIFNNLDALPPRLRRFGHNRLRYVRFAGKSSVSKLRWCKQHHVDTRSDVKAFRERTNYQ